MEHTYGPAVMLAKAYHDASRDDIQFLAESLDVGSLVTSTLLLARLCVKSAAVGEDLEGTHFDLRADTVELFDDSLSNQSAKIAQLSGSDEVDVTTAVTTIAMTGVTALFEGEQPTVNVEQEGITEFGHVVLLGAMAESALLTFSAYSEGTHVFGADVIAHRLQGLAQFEANAAALLALLPVSDFILREGDNS